VSSPSYDPNRLASHDTAAVQDAWSELNEDPERPLTNRAIGGDPSPPGSAFHPLVAPAAPASGPPPARSAIPGPGVPDLPTSPAQTNNRAGGGQEPCGPDDESTLAEALRQSCNTSFAMLGVDLGEEQLRETAEGFGFEQRLEIPLSVTPS